MILETNTDLLLVVFNGISNKFITTVTGLGDLIKTTNKYGISSIKRFDAPKEKFVSISKAKLTSLVNYYTHSYIELQKTNFIK